MDATKESARKPSFRSEWTISSSKKSTRCRPHRFLEFVHKRGRQTLLLVLLGVCASIVDGIIEESVRGLNCVRKELLHTMSGSDSPYVEATVWSVFTIVVALASIAWTAAFDPGAAGSGIPEMKSIISYEHRKDASRCLRARTLISKIGGLTLALGSGVSVGKEGPFVHTSSIIAHRLMKHTRCFRRIYDSDMIRRHIYGAACAVGVTSTFRAPIGGTLFAIEVTSMIFMVSNYWRAFVAALSALIARQLVHLVHEREVSLFRPMFPTSFEDKSFHYGELVLFAVLGALIGFVASTYVSISTAFKQRWKLWAAGKPAVLVAWTILLPLTVILCLPVGLCRLPFTDILLDLTSTTLPDRWHASLSLSVFIVLPLAGLLRLVATALSITLPIPAGDFIPTFTTGAIFGRFFGEVLRMSFPTAGILPGGYALVGGASFVASTTNTTSVAVIALEFTGQFIYTTPLILSTLIASGVGRALRVSIYDSVITKNGFSHLHTLDLEDIKTRDVMLRRFPVLTLNMVQAQLQAVLNCSPGPILPLVDSMDEMVFIGCVSRSAIMKISQLLANDVQLHLVLQLPQPAADVIPVTLAVSKEDYARMSTLAMAVEQDEHEADLPEETPGGLCSADGCTLVVESSSPSANETRACCVLHKRRHVDSSVLQVDPDASLQKVHLLFETIKCSSIWVTQHGRLVGLLHRQHLRTRVAELKRKNGTVRPSSPLAIRSAYLNGRQPEKHTTSNQPTAHNSPSL